MKLNLSDIRVLECAKPSCNMRIIQRHHKGCERMWIRHFKNKYRTTRFKAFKERYHEFRDTDCVTLCEAHHQEVHKEYVPHIADYVRKTKDDAGKYKKMTKYSWQEAENLMRILRSVCDSWLQYKSPGLKRRRKVDWDKQGKNTGRKGL